MPHGWIVLDKPVGLGSTQAVGAVKRNLREAGFGKVKVGHGGTLDPLASGVLPIALGEATKLAGRMLDASKVYAFTIRFGIETAGLDAEGEVVATSPVRPTMGALMAILPRFTGPIEQVPPAFSAIKVGGQRAYARARAGEAVELAARAVTIHALSVRPDPVEGPSCESDGRPLTGGALTGSARAELDEITLRGHVSKGTYIRSLARDIAHSLGTVGHVTMLRREQAGPFTLDQAISLDKLNAIGQGAPLENVILPLEAGLDDIPALCLSPEEAGAVRQGRVLTGRPQSDGLYLAKSGAVPVALIEVQSGMTRIVRGFNLPDVAE